MQLVTLLTIAVKRMANNLGLVILNFLGLLMAVMLLGSIPLYADAATEKGLRDSLAVRPEYSPRPRSSILVEQVRQGGTDLGLYQRADRYITGNAQAILGVPLRGFIRYVQTRPLRLFARKGPGPADLEVIKYAALAFAEGLEGHVNLVEGRFPSSERTPEGEVEVLVGDRVARESALRVGESFVLMEKMEGEAPLQVKVVGLWEAKDPQESYWFQQPHVLDFDLLVTERAFQGAVGRLPSRPIGRAIWYMVFSPRDVDAKAADLLVHNLKALRARTSSLDASLQMRKSPLEILEEHRRGTFLLKVNLYLFSSPVVVILFYYITLASSLGVELERTEVARLKSRGVSGQQIVGLYLLEGLVIGLPVLAIGPFLGMYLAGLIGRAYAFLDFTGGRNLKVSLSPDIYRYVALSIALWLGASSLPALVAARHSIVSLQQEAARAQARPPIWQRYFLDLMLLLVSLYGYYSLRRSGSILGRALGEDPFKNPLLLVLPALFITSLSLFLLASSRRSPSASPG